MPSCEDTGSEDDSTAADSEGTDYGGEDGEPTESLLLGSGSSKLPSAGAVDDDGIDPSNIVLGKRTRRAVNYSHASLGDGDGDGDGDGE